MARAPGSGAPVVVRFPPVRRSTAVRFSVVSSPGVSDPQRRDAAEEFGDAWDGWRPVRKLLGCSEFERRLLRGSSTGGVLVLCRGGFGNHDRADYRFEKAE